MALAERGRRRTPRALGLALLLALTAAACGAPEAARPVVAPVIATPVTPELWPLQPPAVGPDPVIEARVAGLLARMSVEEKVGQIIQADIGHVTPQEAQAYHLGAVLNGGDSGPGGDDRASPRRWLALADAFHAASVSTDGGRTGVPILWGTDAVHGAANVIGAAVFPHNIGLGAANDPDLVARIGAATALEIRITGQDWTFAPTLAAPQDDRWGRTYEGYAEDPQIAASLGAALVEGLQGTAGTAGAMRPPKVLATVKHFIADGGTINGRDQGDAPYTEDELRDRFGPPYYAAIAAGAQSAMVSFSSWRGVKMHAQGGLLGDILRGRMGFTGFMVGDWNGHGQVPGCTNTSCPAAINAGVDMLMAPDGWRGLYAATLAQVRNEQIPQARLDEAVGRILRVKLRMGLFEAGPPSRRPFAGRWDLLGAPAHRALAREAVRKSLVLLKNDGGVLPLRADGDILVAGPGAHDLAMQAGGWTVSWQARDVTRADFPHGETIYEAVRAAAAAAGGRARLWAEPGAPRFGVDRPDAAIVVIGEAPYAEGQGDVADLDYRSAQDRDLALIRALKAAGVPTVVVLLSGRPLHISPELEAADAFVAAWLPGTEGAGIADLLLRGPDGAPQAEFTGRTPYSWPRRPDQTPLNPGDPDYDPLFPLGFGLSLASGGAKAAPSQK